jgi:hypothetical protein
MIVWVSLNRPIFDVTNRNRDRTEPVLGQGLKETAIFDSSNFGPTPLDITSLLRPEVSQCIWKFSLNEL